MTQNELNQYGQLSVDQKRWVDYLRDDFGYTVDAAIKELEFNDWNYEQTDRAILASRPDI